ncbi:helicase-exonuclease AddAB subunit AddB [Evansella cellulosilytica]|uniref:ATP-dependent helicase/deoxyribonuclease subunit B n=1 Tax=Evansella cellulosilytica (strain ATCC 21833 / DSM 2522 / FERM P-1141 / JCM 9156 / N-4) TaxID=649639 RepID=E6U0B0_EVAC2|nr:helicase-exonuclease AddAB subunit AddB [Evansella cellulosilytica]ADU30226.1 ATP-dependent nuclease subunit B [Evansella cellulosilytica DSM 2522]
MSISFILGRTGTGKTTYMLNNMIDDAIKDPQGATIIYLVPDQMTFQSEMQLVQSKQRGMTRIQVLSFSRLALRVLQELGGITKQHIQKTGVQMLIRKIVETEKKSFKVFSKASDTNGFIDQLEQMITELKRYDVSADTLTEQYEALEQRENKRPSEQILQEKLHDIGIVYNNLGKHFKDEYVGAEDYLHLLSEKVAHSNYLKQSHIFIDGFHSFTPLEMLVIQELMLHCTHTTFSFTLDRHYDTAEVLNELDLFFETAKSYQTIQNVCREHNLEVNRPFILQMSLRFKSKAIAHLEKNYEIRPSPVYETNDGIRVISAVHRRSEVEGIAREILHLVRDKSYRFQEIVLILRNITDYTDLLQTVFEDYGIPLFMDQKRSMLNHPVIEFIRSSLEVIYGNWRYEAVFRCLKTDMLFPLESHVSEMRERVDQLENYVLSYGIKGVRWYDKKPWSYRRVKTSADGERKRTTAEDEFEQEINQLRNELTKPLIWLQKQMKASKTVTEKCETIYHYLVMCQIPEKIERMRNDSVASEELQRAKEHDQVWSAIVELLDQMVEMAGDEDVSSELYKKMIDTGVESMKFAIIPPAIDQVIVADMEHSRLSNIRCAFILGVNDGIIPAKPDEGSIVTEEERDTLAQAGINLAPSSTRQLLNETFLMYLAQSTASELLYFTYPLADEEGKSLQPSIVLKRIKDFFPSLEEELWFHEPTDMTDEEQFFFINGSDKTLSYLTFVLQSWKKGYSIPSFWWDVYNWYVANENWNFKVKQVLHSLFYKNKAQQLSKHTSKELYGDHLVTSVSRMEQYQSCAFAQFANYGLRLKERETYKLEAPDVGTLFHAALKEMADYLRRNGKDFSQLSKEECSTLAKKIVEELAPKIQREILLSSNKYHYIKQKLEEVVARASHVLAEQSRSSGFSPIGLEVAFGENQDLPPLQFQLQNGTTMELVGRIDRVDMAEGRDGLYLRIIDYKSSAKNIELSEVYYGLSLQLLIYLDVVITFSERWLGAKASPAGVLYFHVHNPIIQAKEKMTIEQIETELFKQFKMKGLISANTEVAQLMDENMIETKKSNIIPAQLKNDGDFSKNSSVIHDDQYENLKGFLRKKVQQIGQAITEGEIGITPIKNKQKVACTYCAFSSLCQFDPTIETNDYHRISKLKDEEVLLKMSEEGEGEEDEN